LNPELFIVLMFVLRLGLPLLLAVSLGTWLAHRRVAHTRP